MPRLRQILTVVLTTAAAAVPQQHGFSDTIWDSGLVPHSVSVKAFQDAGAQLWRTPVNWQYYEPHENEFSRDYLVSLYDQYVQLRQAGVTPVFNVLGTPYWALTPEGKGASKGGSVCADNDNATPCFAPPDLRDADIALHWHYFLATLAFVMPDAVFEIWNEPNLDWFWLVPQDPALFSLMVTTAGEAIHGSSPTAKVISGSLSNYDGPDTAAETSYPTFMRSMYETLPHSSFDGLGYHSYPCNQTSTPAGWVKVVADDTQRIRQLRDEAGDTGKPLWLTETGVNTSSPSLGNCGTRFSEEEQGPALRSVIDWARTDNDQHGDLPTVMVFSLFDSQPRAELTQPTVHPEYEYGLIAYSHAESGDGVVTLAKPGLADVTCAFAGTC